jgi:hypothetical protein
MYAKLIQTSSIYQSAKPSPKNGKSSLWPPYLGSSKYKLATDLHLHSHPTMPRNRKNKASQRGKVMMSELHE